MSSYLGQNFLKNKSKLKKIVSALKLSNNDFIIEIGGGHGELTNYLVRAAIVLDRVDLLVIEKDKNLVKRLEAKFSNKKFIKICAGDVLKILPTFVDSSDQEMVGRSIKIVGNIPYYITGHLLRILSNLKAKPALIILTVQKEVAERICALPPKMNILAASVQFWAEPRIIGYIDKKFFRPTPQVDSAILYLRPRLDANLLIHPNQYYQFLKVLFKQPRKTILNNLQVIFSNKEALKKYLREFDINEQKRPQDLVVAQIVSFALVFARFFR
jgi:16S rRNA (adenine1518-N6/adenine1519-N6)-dimethyltransferase